MHLGLVKPCIVSNPTNPYRMFFIQTSIPTPSMPRELIKHGKVCMKNNQLLTKSPIEWINDFNIFNVIGSKLFNRMHSDMGVPNLSYSYLYLITSTNSFEVGRIHILVHIWQQMSPSPLSMNCTLHAKFLVLFFVALTKLYVLSFVNPVANIEVGSLTGKKCLMMYNHFIFGKN